MNKEAERDYQDELVRVIGVNWEVAHMSESISDWGYRWDRLQDILSGVSYTLIYFDDDAYAELSDDIQFLQKMCFQHRFNPPEFKKAA